MPFYFLPSVAPTPLRSETSDAVIAALIRKGWQETTPPSSQAGKEVRWDKDSGAWTLIDLPATPPNYSSFEEALKTSSVMTVNNNRMTPAMSLSTPVTVVEIRASLIALGVANQTSVAWNTFAVFLDRVVASGGDGNRNAIITRFQALLWNWTDAAAFGSPVLDAIQNMLNTHMPIRAYTSRRP